jgi:type II secretory pathway component PulK
MALDERIGREEARQLIDGRGSSGYASIGAFLAHPVFGDRPPALSNVAVASDFFRVTAQVTFARGRAGLTSVVERGPGDGTTVRSRSFAVAE